MSESLPLQSLGVPRESGTKVPTSERLQDSASFPGRVKAVAEKNNRSPSSLLQKTITNIEIYLTTIGFFFLKINLLYDVNISFSYPPPLLTPSLLFCSQDGDRNLAKGIRGSQRIKTLISSRLHSGFVDSSCLCQRVTEQAQDFFCRPS